jgi:4'-phosphopantetheinyl transferase
MIQVYILQLPAPDQVQPDPEMLLSYLPPAARLRIKDRLSLSSRVQTLAGEVLARYAIARYTGDTAREVSLIFGEKGKPHPESHPGIYFNISHSGVYVVCAVGEVETGIDVERIRTVNLRVARRYFSDQEIHDLEALSGDEQMAYFITLWTIKESYLKAVGRGLTQNLNSFTVVRKDEVFVLTGNAEAEEYSVRLLPVSDAYRMAVCFPGRHEVADPRPVGLEEILQAIPKYI